MKKIFYILMSAVVALGAVACENTFNDNLDTNNKVSITVVIDETTKVALGELEEGLGQKVKFELNDELLVNRGSGSTENYYFTCTEVNGDEYTFTCEAEGVSSIKGHYLYFYYQGGRKGVADLFGNKEDMTIKGAFLKGEGTLTGSGSIKMKMAPLLKLKSAYPVTVTASDWVFNGYNTITTAGGDEWVYISTHTARTVAITATINGRPAVVKSSGKVTGELQLAMEYNKIYNLGELDEQPKEPEIAVDGDPAGIAIAIDGKFADWANITQNVVTVADGATYNSIKTLKAYTDANNVYLYMEFDMTNPTYHIGVLVDADNDQTTGGSYGSSKIPATGEIMLNNYCVGDGSNILNFAVWSPSFRTWTNGDWASTDTSIESAAPVVLDNGLYAAELAISRANVNVTAKNIGVAVYSLANWGYSGVLPTPCESGNVLVIPVHN